MITANTARRWATTLALLAALLAAREGYAQSDAAARKRLLSLDADPPPRSKLYVHRNLLEVGVSATNGMMTEGLYGSTPPERLTYGWRTDAGSTSHAIFRVDGVSHVQGSAGISVVTPLRAVEGDSACAMTVAVGGVQVEQLVRVERTPDGLESALYQYTMTNTDSRAHTAGILLEMDTQINDNDAAPLSTVYGYVPLETDFLAPDIPSIWQAFEVGPSQGPALLIGQGLLIGGNAVQPDRFAVGSWPEFSGVTWDHAILPLPYGDSSILLWWNEQSLAPGESRRVATYYGLGASIRAPGDLGLSATAPSAVSAGSCTLTPNPIDVIAFVTNALARPATSVQATITFDSPRLTLVTGAAMQPTAPALLLRGAAGRVAWQLHIDPAPVDDSLCYTITAHSSDGAHANNSLYTCTFVPAALDTTIPVATALLPVDGSSVGASRLGAQWSVVDGANNFAPQSVILNANGVTVAAPSTRLTYSGTTLSYQPADADPPFADGDFVTFELTDYADSCGNAGFAPKSRNVRIDLSPPDLADPQPPPDIALTHPPTELSVQVTDRWSRVDLTPTRTHVTIRAHAWPTGSPFTVDGTSLRWVGDRLTFDPVAAGLAIAPDDTLTMTVDLVCDRPDTLAENCATDWAWTVHVTSTGISPTHEPAPSTPDVRIEVLSPNPSHEGLRARVTTLTPGAIRASLVDVLGREVERLADGLWSAGAHDLCSTRALPSGTYWLRVTADGRTTSAHFAVVR